MKIFVIVGRLSIPPHVVYEILCPDYEPVKCWFVDSDDHYLQSKFSYAHTTGKKIEAILVGPIPHSTFAAGSAPSMISKVRIAKSLVPVYDCRTKSGVLKLTKSSITFAVAKHMAILAGKQKQEEEQKILSFKKFLTTVFPNQKIM
jgi:hypothetical protein